MIELLAVKFNHDTGSARADALSIRKNATQAIAVPEWVKGMTKPEDSLAAYALRPIAGHTVTIRAKFARLDPSITSAYIRAIQPPPPPPPPGWGAWVHQMLERFPILWWLVAFMFVTGHGKNVLGDVKEHEVTFGAQGETEYEPFDLEHLWMAQRGVGVHEVHWRWQYRLNKTSPWTDFDDSRHRIYTVLDVPTGPWQQQPYSNGTNDQLPWTDVLDYACRWAAWTSTLDDAATQVTRALNKLGGSILTYSGLGHWFISFHHNYFECTDFLKRLAAPAGTALQRVDCSDSATALSTFANVLGCDLAQSQMNSWTDPDQFVTNPIRAIGGSYHSPTTWTYHEVAWKGTGSASDALFDASLHLNGNSNPANSPYSDLDPVNIVFGAVGSGGYRDKLAAATPAGNRAKCYPKQKPVRRTVR